MSTKTGSPRSIKHAASVGTATLFGVGGVFALAYFALPALLSVSYTESFVPATTTPAAVAESPRPSVVHLPTPKPLKALYMTQCVVGTPSFRSSLVQFIEESELNAIVIDIKDYTGKIAFPTTNSMLEGSVSDQCGARDMQQFVETLHEKGIYVIGRITVFQDPFYSEVHPELAVKRLSASTTPWRDYKGLAFIDVGARPFWDYIAELSKESYYLGFDELNYDYIRYPSDGNMKDTYYSWSTASKAETLERFFEYLSSVLRPVGVVLSADLFGYVTVHEDDLGIGQVLERALPYFNYIDPMVYPSHYNKGFAGLADVNADPYKVVHVSLEAAVARTIASTTPVQGLTHTPIMKTTVVPATATTATTTKEVATGIYRKNPYPATKIRPWLQSFDYPTTYTPAMVEAQIKANEDVGLDSYLMWDAANKYTALRSLFSQPTSTQ